MTSNHVIGARACIVHRIILSEGSPITLPDGCSVLKAEVVVNGDDEELLELWLAVPSVGQVEVPTTRPDQSKVIYSNTVVYDEETRQFNESIEQGVKESLENYQEWGEIDDWEDN